MSDFLIFDLAALSVAAILLSIHRLLLLIHVTEIRNWQQLSQPILLAAWLFHMLHILAARVKLDHINVKLFCSILSCLSVHKILHEINPQSDIQTSDIMSILSGSDRPATIYLPHCRAPVDNCIQI